MTSFRLTTCHVVYELVDCTNGNFSLLVHLHINNSILFRIFDKRMAFHLSNIWYQIPRCWNSGEHHGFGVDFDQY